MFDTRGWPSNYAYLVHVINRGVCLGCGKVWQTSLASPSDHDRRVHCLRRRKHLECFSMLKNTKDIDATVLHHGVFSIRQGVKPTLVRGVHQVNCGVCAVDEYGAADVTSHLIS